MIPEPAHITEQSQNATGQPHQAQSGPRPLGSARRTRYGARGVSGQASIILLIEPDTALAGQIVHVLSGAALGCLVWHVTSAADARAVLKHQAVSLIVLDLTLPDIDGLVLCTQLKAKFPDVSVMACGPASTAQTVLAFRLGAEDVLKKPFAVAELEARVEAILRRRARAIPPPPISASPSLVPRASHASLGTLQVDVRGWRVTLNGKPLDVTPTEFRLLAFMVNHAGTIVSRQELAAGVWGSDAMAHSRSVDAYVRRINAKLRTGPGAPQLLNVRGVGFQLSITTTPRAA